LRSPVTTLRTMAQALEDGTASDPERRSRAIGALVRTSDRLLNLVTDLLDLARLDMKELPIHLKDVDVRELAAAAVSAHTVAAAEARIALLPVEAGPPVIVSADPDRLTQVLDNLLENAIRYAGGGSEVRVAVEDGPATRLIVSDNGRGIPAKHLPYIFEPFYRADPVRTPGDSPSGLGLRIARGLIEAHGGELTLASEEAKGTTVVITLPQP
jgi:two-component system, OmpR family, sensor histidine kinase VicK